MAGTQQVVDVHERCFGQQADGLTVDDQNLLAHEFLDTHPLAADLAERVSSLPRGNSE